MIIDNNTGIINALGLEKEVSSKTQTANNLSYKSVITTSSEATSSTKLGDLSLWSELSSSPVLTAKNSSGGTTYITLTSTTTIEDVVTRLNSAGLSATFSSSGVLAVTGGEVSGNATIEENIPEGMSLANNDGTWEEQEGKLIKVIPELGAGETKEYTVLLNWEQTGENMGEKANEVKLVETGNVPGFVDNNDKDNTSNANVIISVETGELPIGLILALVALVGLETVTLRYAVVLTKRQKKKVNKK